MNHPFRVHRLVTRGGWGLTCDYEGLAIGPIDLITRSENAVPLYEAVSTPTLREVAAAIYGIHADERHQYFLMRVEAIADAMSKGQHALASISAVHMCLGSLSREIEGRLTKVAAVLHKINPYWPVEPRDRRGRWTNEGENPIVPVIEPYTPECLAAIEMAKRICIGHYTTAGGGLGFDWMRRCIRNNVPLECGY